MVFKRRDRRTIGQVLTESVYPRGGWLRAYHYVRHRLHRLPDTPERIARGLWAGVFASFTPFFGFHLILSWILAKVMRGNVLAALLGTFFGNPLTYVPIAMLSIETGHFLLGRRPSLGLEQTLGDKFSAAWADLWHNILAIFGPGTMEWGSLTLFYHDIFLPFAVGSLLPGVIVSTIVYYISVPVLRAYQNSRRKRLRAKLDKLGQGNADPH